LLSKSEVIYLEMFPYGIFVFGTSSSGSRRCRRVILTPQNVGLYPLPGGKPRPGSDGPDLTARQVGGCRLLEILRRGCWELLLIVAAILTWHLPGQEVGTWHQQLDLALPLLDRARILGERPFVFSPTQ
jgi:hypothetical protein